jgi:hypothetical protein
VQIKIPGQTIFLVAPDDTVRRRWVNILQAVVYIHKTLPERVSAITSGGAENSDDDDDD